MWYQIAHEAYENHKAFDVDWLLIKHMAKNMTTNNKLGEKRETKQTKDEKGPDDWWFWNIYKHSTF